MEVPFPWVVHLKLPIRAREFKWRDAMKPGGNFDVPEFDVVKNQALTFEGDHDRQARTFWQGTHPRGYCIASHTAVAGNAGMTDAMFGELMAVVGRANETKRLASGYQVEIDEQFRT